MNKIHEKKSPCCRVKVYRFGNKRRQCSGCKRTWTVWKKKRGRDPLRPNHKLLNKVVIEKQSLLTPKFNPKGLTDAAMSVRFRRTMDRFLEKSDPNRLPSGRLILIIDAIWFLFANKRWTLYLMAVRAVDQNKAVVMDPILRPGKENHEDWNDAVATIHERVRKRIAAVVCDGFRGTARIARENGWIVQRCHFHLISQLQVNRGRWKQLPDSPEREAVYQAVRKVLGTRPEKLNRCVEELTALLSKTDCPRRLGMIGREFLRRLDHFRAYINHPELKLPHTTNAIESFNKIIRTRCRHLRTPESLLLRATTVVRMRKTMTCNPKTFQQN